MVAIQSPRVQTRAVQAVTQKLGDAIDGDIQVGSVRIMPFNSLVLKDILILDKNPYSNLSVAAPADTFFVAESISATLSFARASSRPVSLSQAMFLRYGHSTESSTARTRFASVMLLQRWM